MGETFYSVLGVDPDADTARIKEAYREKVKAHHPDVSDESDAAEQFQRITEARDVLVDQSDRKRYDRMGHDAYIRRHLDSSAWSTSNASEQRTRRSDGHSRRGGSGRSRRSRGESSRSNTRGSNTGTRASDTVGENGTTAGDRRTGESSRETGERSRERQSRATDGSTGDDRTAWMGEDGWSTSGNTASNGGARNTARADSWEAQHAATNVYSPTGRDATGANEQVQSRFARIARGVGPWIVFHFVFLISAFVTIYLLMSWSPTIPTMFVSLLLLGTAIFFSILHMISRMYS